MKQNKPLQRLAAAAVVVLLTAGCTQGEAEPGTETGAMVPLTIEASLTGELVQPATRALINTEGAKIGVFLTTQNGYKPMYDKKYTYTAGVWKAAEPVYVDARAARVHAFYDPTGTVTFPANSFVTNPNALTAQLYADNKLWYYDDRNTSVNNASPTIAFKMKPAYARVILSIQRHATSYVAGVCAITNVTFSTNSQFISSGTIDISSSAVGGTPAAPWTINPPINGIAAGDTNTACDVLLPPQPITAGLTLALTIDGAVRTVIATPDKFPGSKLEPGKKYTIHLLITDTEVLPDGGVNSGEYGGDGTAITNNDPKEI